ncbi:MAG: type 1 glutamine amidotransferase [Gaiellales bacterium]
MRVLSLTHEPAPTGGGGTFERRAAELGHELTVCETPVAGLPPAAAEFDAIMVFGGAMHPDQDAEHPWLVEETEFLAQALSGGVPLLGVCLGSQLIARAAGSWVGPGEVGEVGWCEVGLTQAGLADPVVGAAFPAHFEAFQWHYYTWRLPAGAELLATNGAALQSYRLGRSTWAVQFHPEVNETMLDHWFTTGAPELPMPQDVIRRETAEKLPLWEQQGRRLADAFLTQAANAR